MAIQFDGNGVVSLPTYAPTGTDAFTLTITFTYSTTGNDQYVLSTTTNTANYIRCTGGKLDVRVNFTTFSGYHGSGGTYADGEEITLVIQRVAGGDTTISDGGTPSAPQSTSNGTFNRLGQNSGGTIIYDGEISALSMTGGNVGDRTYDFNQTPGSTVLPDTVSSQDGTLSGFTTGGFITAALTITSIGDYESKQRDSLGQATFTISGTKDATNTDIEYSLDKGDTWQVLDSPGVATSFSGTVTITGVKDILLRFAANPNVTASVVGVAAVMHIVCWWQSNCRGQGLVDTVTDVQNYTLQPTMKVDTGFKPLADPCDIAETAGGSMWPRVASKFGSKGVPVCISNVAVDGTTIAQWLKGAPEAYYDRITTAVNALGGVEAIVSVGGESDSSSSKSEAAMTTDLLSMVDSLNTDFGANCYIVKFPIGDTTGGNQAIWDGIRAAYDTVVTSRSFCYSGGDLSVIDIDTTTAGGNDGIHIKQAADIQQGADIVYSSLTNSSLDLTFTDINDGTYRIGFHHKNTRELIDVQDVAFTSGTASVTLETIVPSTVIYQGIDEVVEGGGGSNVGVTQ